LTYRITWMDLVRVNMFASHDFWRRNFSMTSTLFRKMFSQKTVNVALLHPLHGVFLKNYYMYISELLTLSYKRTHGLELCVHECFN
jgi:hypothetical protein